MVKFALPARKLNHQEGIQMPGEVRAEVLIAPLPTHAKPFVFASVLRRRLDDYFRDHHVSPKATPLMWAKIVLGLLAFVVSYGALYARPWTPLEIVGLYVLHGLTQLYLLLNLAHDVNHNAISHRHGVNQAFSYVFDLCGINSYIWRILHNKGHHPNINIVGVDEDIIARNYVRLSPDTPPHRRYTLQHLYAWFLYGFSSLDYVLMKDVEYFFFHKYGPLERARHPRREYVILIATKLFYFTYILILPYVVLGISIWTLLIAFVAMHFAIGLLAQLVFQPGHAIDSSRFPSRKSEFENYTFHIFATTADFSTRSTVALLFLGGLNHHVVHHLCPGVCHTHYPHLTKIVSQTAEEYDIPYREYPNIWRALIGHFSHLKRLSSTS